MITTLWDQGCHTEHLGKEVPLNVTNRHHLSFITIRLTEFELLSAWLHKSLSADCVTAGWKSSEGGAEHGGRTAGMGGREGGKASQTVQAAICPTRNSPHKTTETQHSATLSTLVTEQFYITTKMTPVRFLL